MLLLYKFIKKMNTIPLSRHGTEFAITRTHFDNQFKLSVQGRNKFDFERAEAIWIPEYKLNGKIGSIASYKITNYEPVIETIS